MFVNLDVLLYFICKNVIRKVLTYLKSSKSEHQNKLSLTFLASPNQNLGPKTYEFPKLALNHLGGTK